MPRLTEATRQRRRDDIAAAAMRRFAAHGFAATSMADIIQEAGSSAGSVYANFENKAELIRYAASGALRSLVATVTDDLPSDRTPASVLAHLLESSRDRTRAQTVMNIWAEIPRDEDLASVGRQSVAALRSEVGNALLPWCHGSVEAADELSEAVVTAVQGFVVRIAIDRDVDPDRLAAQVVAAFSHAQ